MTKQEGVEMDMNIGFFIVVSARAMMSFIYTYMYICMCVHVARPRVRDGKPAEVVCGYFGDWFYRVANGTRAQLLYSRATSSSSSSSSLSLSLFSLSVLHECVNMPDISRQAVRPNPATKLECIQPPSRDVNRFLVESATYE